jgi:hypothetical protein
MMVYMHIYLVERRFSRDRWRWDCYAMKIFEKLRSKGLKTRQAADRVGLHTYYMIENLTRKTAKMATLQIFHSLCTLSLSHSGSPNHLLITQSTKDVR